MLKTMTLLCVSVASCCLVGTVGCNSPSQSESPASQESTDNGVASPPTDPALDVTPTSPAADNSSPKNGGAHTKPDNPRVGKFAELDTDQDGLLSLAEFSVDRKPKNAAKWFERRDANRDGVLSLAEFAPQSASQAVNPTTLIKGWGESEDPAGGTKIELQGTTLVMTSPAVYIDNFPKGAVNAPRVLQEVSGDFTADVKIMHVDPALPNSVLKSLGGFPTAYHAGALFLLANEKNLVRFERVSKNTDGILSTTCELQVWESGKLTAHSSEKIEDTVIQLRIERRGDLLLCRFSQDNGMSWKELPQHKHKLKDTVKVGVSVTNNTDPGCTVKFEDLKVVKGAGR